MCLKMSLGLSNFSGISPFTFVQVSLFILILISNKIALVLTFIINNVFGEQDIYLHLYFLQLQEDCLLLLYIISLLYLFFDIFINRLLVYSNALFQI